MSNLPLRLARGLAIFLAFYALIGFFIVPGVALRIIELAQDPDVVMATAADTIGLDAALSARMLRIANSPLYASRRRVENLSQALTVLGLNATLTLALGFSLAHCGPGSHPVARERVWRRSQFSWAPNSWSQGAFDDHRAEEGPWLRMFRNARRWVG